MKVISQLLEYFVERGTLTAQQLHLSMFTIAGFGGSDMSPGLRRLAEDPEVEVAMVITDGYIEYPAEPMPYHVLWALTAEHETFSPPYGQILRTFS